MSWTNIFIGAAIVAAIAFVQTHVMSTALIAAIAAVVILYFLFPPNPDSSGTEKYADYPSSKFGYFPLKIKEDEYDYSLYNNYEKVY